jgi:hypothetical protein
MVLGNREIGLCYLGSAVIVQAIYFGVDRATRNHNSWDLVPRFQSAIEIAGFDFFNWILQLSIITLRYKLKEEKNKKLKPVSEVFVAAQNHSCANTRNI